MTLIDFPKPPLGAEVQIDTIDPRRDSTWEDFVLEASGATVFHSTAWAHVLQNTYRFQPRYLVAREGSAGIIAGIPLLETRGRRVVSLPFSDQCAPLISDDAAGGALLMALKNMVRTNDASSVELRGEPPADLESQGFYPRETFVNHALPLDATLAETEMRFDKSARHASRKARRLGVTVRISMAREDMQRFYLLHVLTRKRHGLLPQPWQFFDNIHRHFVQSGCGHVLMVEHEGRLVAAGVDLAFKDTLYSKFMASDMRFKQLSAGNLLHCSEVELALSLGCRTLDLGRSDITGTGLRAFKSSCGGIEEPLPYFHYPTPATNGVVTSPSSLPRKALAVAVRFAPLWALRHAGALIYKYAG